MRVTEIWRFPVKSMGGETLLEAEVTDLRLESKSGGQRGDFERRQ